MAKPRIVLGKLCIRLGKFIESLAVAVMKPEDLAEFSKRTYVAQLAGWNRPTIVRQGLEAGEQELFERIPFKSGRMLVLCVGTGREAIVFAKKGFEVTGVDFVSEMIEIAKANAREHGVSIEGLVQEISKLDMTPESFDIAWISNFMYSSIPTKNKRINTLKKIREALKPEGYFVCRFLMQKTGGFFLRPKEIVRRIMSFVTLGNWRYEEGDLIWASCEFAHQFPSENAVKSEFQEAGFDTIFFNHKVSGETSTGALLKKSVKIKNNIPLASEKGK